MLLRQAEGSAWETLPEARKARKANGVAITTAITIAINSSY